MLGDIDGPGFVERARRMGRNMGGKSYVAVVAGPLGEDQPFGEHELSTHLGRAGAGAIIADTDSRMLAIVALPAKRGERAVFDELSAAPARVGLSRIVTADRLASAVHEALKAFAATHPGPENSLVRFEDLGVLRLLMSLTDTAELARFVEDELGRLLQHDAGSANQLVPTLRVFIDRDGRKSEAAQKLFIQRRTLYYRLDRIGGLIGRSLDEPATRHRLQVAPQGMELLQQRLDGPHGAGDIHW